jgi:hypothetical protein
MPTITRRWKKWLAVGCSHGHLIKDSAAGAALEFKRKFQPDKVLHLGDFVDLAAFRCGGNPGGSDAAQSISEDLNAGINFLRELEPDEIFIGNHEDRLYHLAKSPNAIAAHCANDVIGKINDRAKETKAKLHPYDIERGWLKLGDTLFGHGYMCGEQAIRDHAESIGRCVIAHLHRVGEAPGRRSDRSVAYCVGMLADGSRLDYAKTRRAKLAWANGFGWGYYCDEFCTVHLESALPDGTWRLPI